MFAGRKIKLLFERTTVSVRINGLMLENIDALVGTSN